MYSIPCTPGTVQTILRTHSRIPYKKTPFLSSLPYHSFFVMKGWKPTTSASTLLSDFYRAASQP
jgi:hypothetical protein